MKSRILACATAASLLCGGAAWADEGLATFKQVAANPAEPPAQDAWGPVPSAKLSLANLAPGLFPYFNNGPVFGLPGTVTGPLKDRTQLTGDWGGTRTDFVRGGVFIDIYSTTGYQRVTAGGLRTGDATVQNTQISINVDTGRAGLWPGGMFHFTFQSRYGDAPSRTFSVGSYAPQYVGFVHPGPLYENQTLPTEYFLAQALSKKVSVVVGAISDVFIPDQTLFGDSYKYYFANFNFNKNPMTTNFYNPTALALLGVWTPTPWLAFGGGVLDPNTHADNFGKYAFDGVNLYFTSIVSYHIGNLPGQFSPSVNWSNQKKVDLDSPYGVLSPSEIPEAVGALVGAPISDPLPRNYRKNSGFVIANFSQYLFVKESPTSTEWKLKSGQPLRGVGVFGRIGFAPEGTNPVSRDGSVAVFARGLLDVRPNDSFGAGYYYDGFGKPLRDDISRLTQGGATLRDEKGVEVFYDFAFTPAIRLTPSYQHIFNPFTADVVRNQRGADVFLLRFNLTL